MKVAIIIISFILEGILSNYLPVNGILAPLFTLVSLVIVYPYFNGNKREYYKYAFFLGLIYDIVYTDTIIYYAFMFLLISYMVTSLMRILSDNYLNLVIITVILIVIFRIITYILMVITGNLIFNYHTLLKGIYNSLLINIIYALLLLFITDTISKKFNIKKSSY